jgi:branched-chain amino acid transport system permease protein
MIIDIIITGLINGGTYALLAIGFSLIFGVARIVNIAHTAFYMVASYCVYTATFQLGLNAALGMVLGVVVVSLIGVVTYKIFIAPIREHESVVLIATIALATVLQEAMQLIYSGDYLSVQALIPGFTTLLGVSF